MSECQCGGACHQSSEERRQAIQIEYNRLRGKMAGMLESFGLPEKQERACVSILKTLTYDSQEKIEKL